MFNALTQSSFLNPGATKCAIPECPNPCYVDDDGTVHQCCSRTHAREFEARFSQTNSDQACDPTCFHTTTTATQAPGAAMSSPAVGAIFPSPPPPSPSSQAVSSALPPSQKCAIVECPYPRYVDESGIVHECCGITHAMEHQRRLALMQRELIDSAYCIIYSWN